MTREPMSKVTYVRRFPRGLAILGYAVMAWAAFAGLVATVLLVLWLAFSLTGWLLGLHPFFAVWAGLAITLLSLFLIASAHSPRDEG